MRKTAIFPVFLLAFEPRVPYDDNRRADMKCFGGL